MSRRPAHRVRGRWLAACWMVQAIFGGSGATEIAAQVPDSRADIEALSSRVDEMFTEFTDQTPGCAVSVDHRGQLLHAAGYGLADLAHGIPIRPTTVFDLASVSKQFTAAAVLLLAREGRVSLDDEVREHLPWLPRYERPITVRQLIHQTSGLRDVLSLWSLSGRDPEDHLQPRAVEAAIRRQAGLNHLPGARHSYSNTNYYLLARLVEAVDGRSFRDFLADELFGPLGMESTGVLADHGRIVPAMAESYAEGDDGELRRRLLKTDLVGASEAYSTVLDMARWNAFLAGASDPGVGGPAFVDSLFATSRLYGSGEENVYAFGVQNVSRRGVREISHGGTWGGFRTYFRHYPDSGLGVAVLCNQLEISPFQLSARVADVYLGDLVTGPEPEYRPPGAGRNTAPGAPVSREAVAPLLGRYYSPELDAVHAFSHEDGALWVQAGWQEPVRLSLRGELEFEHEGRTWSFAVEDGQVMGLRLDSGRVRGIDFERVSGPAIPEARSGPQTRGSSSCGGTDADTDVRLGMNAWYDFDFQAAESCFRAAAELAPESLMPRLGLVLAHLRPLEGEITDGAFETLSEIDPTPSRREERAEGNLELGLLLALENLVPGSREEDAMGQRFGEFAAAMGDVWRRHPAELDAAGLHVAGLLASAGGRRDPAIYSRVEAAADSILAVDPYHRGALHYKIHAVDHPNDAERGLDAARTYARVAGTSHHALHMPSHIFLALGMWEEVETANRRAWKASRTSASGSGSRPDDHAVHWLIYALLQQRREHEAAAWMDSLSSHAVWSGRPNWFRVELARAALIADADSGLTAWAEPRAPFDSLRGTGRATQTWASGVAAFRNGDRQDLLDAIQALVDQGAARPGGEGETFQDLMNLELGGLLRVLDGQCTAAVELWSRAARIEADRPFGFGPPNPPVPAGNLLAAGLRCVGRGAEAHSLEAEMSARHAGRRTPAWVTRIGE